jgi:hypothetical protein
MGSTPLPDPTTDRLEKIRRKQETASLVPKGTRQFPTRTVGAQIRIAVEADVREAVCAYRDRRLVACHGVY